uniref:C2 domain-containing protein n=1 Tax=Odontella aurita TaxID=265563 RepID=A0A7S4JID1_9STRA|mmetsp:Transcript_46643/g.141326  ORF Transcript_46643/g.141326 Transcript_46643/m.141326 type:complete len:232 (+) Transcript_46643:148-843(+)
MSTRLQLYLRAEKLKNVAGLFHGTSDPYCVVTVTGGAHDGTEIGRTSTVKNTLNPEWTDVFTIDFHRPGLFTEISVEVFDEIKKKDDKFMGSAKFVISDVIDTKGNEKGEEVENGGMIFLHVVESIRGDSSGWFNFQIRALDIKNIESGLLGIGATDPFFEISRKYADHSTGVSRWYTVYRSKPIMDNHNPVWDEDSIGMEELCHCDPKWPLKVGRPNFFLPAVNAFINCY